jgi:C4-dicarboxylate transporter DctQ subunit
VQMMIDLVDRALARCEIVLILCFATLALILGITQIVLRYVFNTGIHWAEAVFVICTVAGMMFAGSLGVRDDRHVRVDLVPSLVPSWLRRVFDLAALCVSFALCAYFAYCGARYVAFLRMIESVSPATGLEDWIFYLLVPVTLGAFSIRYAIRIVDRFRHEPKAEAPFKNAEHGGGL